MPILRLEAPYVDALLKVLARLPTEQAKDHILGPIIKQLMATTSNYQQQNKYSLSQPERALRIELQDKRKVFVVPNSLQVEIMDIFHKSPVMGGHPQTKQPSFILSDIFIG